MFFPMHFLYMAYSTSDLEMYTFKAYDITGRLLYTKIFKGGTGRVLFNFNNHNSGIYFYNISYTQGNIVNKGTFVIIR